MRGADAAAERSSGTPSTLDAVCQFGESLFEVVGEMALGVLNPQALAPRTLYTLTGDPLQRSTEALRLTLAGDSMSALGEVLNKSEIFALVAAVSGLLDVPSRPPFPLPELVDRAYALGDFPALWALEGLGHEYGDAFWQSGETPRRLLRDGAARGVPAGSLLMLHAGVGLSVAQNLLRGLGWELPADELRRRVAEIVSLDLANSRAGYVGAAFESLGLVTRSFHPTLVPEVDRVLGEVASRVRGFYWHGVGRAIYFSPVNFLPCSAWQCFEMARREAPDEAARLSATAGVAWAAVLVNQRQPEILFDLVVGPHGDDLAADGGFVNGLSSSLMMRYDTSPEAPFIAGFYDWEPPAATPGARARWDELVRIPGRRALDEVYPVLKRRNRLGEIFEYREPAELTGVAPRAWRRAS